jgi:hypothetical protein
VLSGEHDSIRPADRLDQLLVVELEQLFDAAANNLQMATEPPE